ncbi:Uncharacterised protein [Mycobacterium tuberculosis]|uniref:Uncharacterized protein n=4 Tax=Mycobacterium tuberculosis TaxID=1773 RepID=A0A655D1K4_MYCTX|nr:Uncharacterised protein [Mycobacterium tuberculosis]CNV70751.1 Uncharacterised protein [Mycobacterium tuberculosis]
MAATATTPVNTSSAVGAAPAIPHGRNRFASSASSTVSRIPAAHSTSASRGPAYSRTMASCTIVNSRWVAGLSTGSRPVSATMTITNATKASTPASDTTWPGWSIVLATSAPRLADPAGMDSANTASRIVGSTSAAMVISRLAPMPPKEVPVSMPARVSATVPRNSSPTTANKSALGSRGDPVATRGAIAAIKSVVPATITGAAANTIVVPAGVICCLPSCLSRSRHGCSRPAPARPSQRARTCRVIPMTSGAPTMTPPICAAPAR